MVHVRTMWSVALASAVVAVLCGILLLVPFASAAGRADAVDARAASASATPGPTLARARAVMQDFITAYNEHDVAAVIALFDADPPGSASLGGETFKYGDCDYALRVDRILTTLPAVRRWLRARFEENDHFAVTAITQNRNPRVVGFESVRSNDILTAQGLALLEANTKFVLSASGDRMVRNGVGGQCTPGDLGVGASQGRTQGMIQAFLDAYNAGDAGRLAELVTKGVTYSDCGYGGSGARSARGRSAVIARFRSLIRRGDMLQSPEVKFASPDRPNIVNVEIERSSASMRDRGAAPIQVNVKVTLGGGAFDRIGSLVFGCPRSP